MPRVVNRIMVPKDGPIKSLEPVVVQSFSCVRFFATPWIAAHQPFLSITNSWSLLKLMSTESVMPSNHLILCCPLLLPPSIFPSIRVFSNENKLRGRGNGGYRWEVANQLILRWEIILNYLSGPSVITKVLIHERGRQGCYCKSQKRRCDDGSKNQTAAVCEALRLAAVLLALMVEEGVTSHRMWVDSETGQDQEAFSSRVSRKNTGVSLSTPRSQSSEI